jgi:hypothetical protein
MNAADAGGGKGKMVANVLSLCSKTTLSVDNNLEAACKACIIVCMRFVDRQQLFHMVLGDMYVDWTYVLTSIMPDKRNFLGDSGVWMDLLDMFDFSGINIPEKEMQRTHPALFALFQCVKRSGNYSTHQPNLAKHGTDAELLRRAMDTRNGMLCFDDVCRLYVLMNVENMTSSHVVEEYLSKKGVPRADALRGNILSSVADVRQSSDGYANTLNLIIRGCKLDTVAMSHLVAYHGRVTAARKETAQQKAIQCRKFRPSMREAARSPGSSASVAESVAESSQSGASHTTFDNYCDIVRFPNSMSRLLRMRYVHSKWRILDFKNTCTRLPTFSRAGVTSWHARRRSTTASTSRNSSRRTWPSRCRRFPSTRRRCRTYARASRRCP